jgi:hypothetical protein
MDNKTIDVLDGAGPSGTTLATIADETQSDQQDSFQAIHGLSGDTLI